MGVLTFTNNQILYPNLFYFGHNIVAIIKLRFCQILNTFHLKDYLLFQCILLSIKKFLFHSGPKSIIHFFKYSTIFKYPSYPIILNFLKLKPYFY